LDAYVLGVDKPLDEYTGRCIAIVHRLDDDDDKLVVVPDGVVLGDDEIRTLTHFQERFFESEIVRACACKSDYKCKKVKGYLV
jgi:inorganic pyrophosphatase